MPGGIEQHTIYQIPLDQRHGRPRQLFTLWCGANLNVLTVVTGALGTTLFGLSFVWGVVAILTGNLVGSLFMALHAAQGPRLGVPQMVQSRGQFGAKGAAFVVALAGIVFIIAVIFWSGFILGATEGGEGGHHHGHDGGDSSQETDGSKRNNGMTPHGVVIEQSRPSAAFAA